MAISRGIDSLDNTASERSEGRAHANSSFVRIGVGAAAVTLILLLLIAVAVSSPSLQVRAVTALAAAATGRDVRIDSLQITPQGLNLDVRFRGLHVGQPGWAPREDMASGVRDFRSASESRLIGHRFPDAGLTTNLTGRKPGNRQVGIASSSDFLVQLAAPQRKSKLGHAGAWPP